MAGRIVLVPFSPRVAPGLVSAAAWRLMTGPDAVVHTGSPDHPVLPYLDDADVQIVVFDAEAGAYEIAVDLIAQAEAGTTVVWIAAPDGDEALAQALGRRLPVGRRADAPVAGEVPAGRGVRDRRDHRGRQLRRAGPRPRRAARRARRRAAS